AKESRARPMRPAITTIDIGQNIRSHQVADPHACGPRILQLERRGPTEDRILNGAPQAAELAVAEDADHPGGVDLPVIASTDGPEPAGAALALADGKGHERARGLNGLITSPQTAAGAAKDVEAGPAVDWRNRCGRLRIGPGQIGRNRRPCESRYRGQSEQDLFHLKNPNCCAFAADRVIPITQRCREYSRFQQKCCCLAGTVSGKRVRETSTGISLNS